MSRQIKAKMSVSSLTPQNYAADGSKSGEVVDLYAVHSSDPTSENYSYSKATPNAHLNMVINNPEAFGFFTPGKQYIVTFEEAAS
jgi:hypothetical protein